MYSVFIFDRLISEYFRVLLTPLKVNIVRFFLSPSRIIEYPVCRFDLFPKKLMLHFAKSLSIISLLWPDPIFPMNPVFRPKVDMEHAVFVPPPPLVTRVSLMGIFEPDGIRMYLLFSLASMGVNMSTRPLPIVITSNIILFLRPPILGVFYLKDNGLKRLRKG